MDMRTNLWDRTLGSVAGFVAKKRRLRGRRLRRASFEHFGDTPVVEFLSDVRTLNAKHGSRFPD